MTYSSSELAGLETPIWFCLKAQPKREHLAATGLRRQLKIDCFSPRLRFRKMTQRGALWFVEAMFPGYLFAQFVYSEYHRWVAHSPGIRGIVHFGDRVAALHPSTVVTLQQTAGPAEIVTVDSSVEIGEPVQLTEGPLRGLELIVTRLLPARDRVRVLLEFLGRPVETELSAARVLPLTRVRRMP